MQCICKSDQSMKTVEIGEQITNGYVGRMADSLGPSRVQVKGSPLKPFLNRFSLRSCTNAHHANHANTKEYS